MKKVILMAAVIMTMVGCTGTKVDQANVQSERDSLQAIIAEKDNELNEFMGVFSEIQEGLRQMSEAEGRITVAEANPERVNKTDQIREDMQFLSEAAKQTRERIATLEEKLKNSTLNVDKMKKAIVNLKEQLDMQTARVQELEVKLAERDVVIAEQTQTIAKQDETINTINQDNEAKAQEIAEQTRQLNEAWYVFGTKSELKAQKIISDGEVLTKGDFNKAYFTQIDIRNTKEIKLYSKNAKLLTKHPAGSYTLEKDAKGEYALRIYAPKDFWSLTRYLVIQVK
ncbi:MAG: hypothetical protein HUK00_03110 [Bacteroidaceae bacterium]|nr:hypothetical protein [Bacteroidaceae bacterium]